jgi:hypothetical protein
MPVAAIDMHGDSCGDPSAARGIHYRAAQGRPRQRHKQQQQLSQTSHISMKKAMDESISHSHAAYK